MRRKIYLVIIFTIMLFLVGCNSKQSGENVQNNENTQDVENTQSENMSAEIRRAIDFGLVPEEIQGDYEKTITHRQYCEMLTNFMRVYDESRLSEWENTISLAAQSDKEMKREDGILAIAYALVHMNRIEYSGSDWEYFDKVGAYIDTYGYDLTWDYPLFPNWEDTSFEWINSNYIQGGLTMCAVEKSHVSGLAIYPYDFEREGKHFKDELSREEAICAVLRLAETEDIYAENIPVPNDMDFSDSADLMNEIATLVEERKQNILNNNESVSCTGIAYYVSNTGDDNNDGTSPETAWATLDKVKNHQYGRGDAVYFERGGIWRGAAGYFYDTVTIAAYGEGDKPRIYGSPENGANADLWDLYIDEDGMKIWKYNGTNLDCAGIVLNDGEDVARRVYSWYDGQNYYDSANLSSPFDMKVALCEDLYFYCDIEMEKGSLPIRPDVDELPVQIYLRCDKGNPGELYNSIEFISKVVTEDVAMFAFGPDCVMDNICIMYNAGTAVSMTEYDNFTIQNCEFGWCGTRLEVFNEQVEDEAAIWTDGNVIQLIGSNCVVKNNYIHDVDGGGISFELGGDISDRAPFKGNRFTGNLIERCGDPLYIRNNDPDEVIEKAFGDMEIDDNYVIDTGYGWYENQPSYINPAFHIGESQNALNFYGGIEGEENSIRVTNNIFCRSYHGLLYFKPGIDVPYFEGNIFIQNYGETVVETADTMLKATQAEEIKDILTRIDIHAEEVRVLEPQK